MSSLYADYLSERTYDYIIESDKGFATYRYVGENQVYIVDIYVRPSFRKMGIAKELADKICAIAKSEGCLELIGSIAPSAKGSHESMLILIAYGMTLDSCSDNLIIFKKGL